MIYSLGAHSLGSTAPTIATIGAIRILTIELYRLLYAHLTLMQLHLVHLGYQLFKAILDVGVTQGRALPHIDQLFSYHKLFYLFRADLSLLTQVYLVGHQTYLYFLIGVVS